MHLRGIKVTSKRPRVTGEPVRIRGLRAHAGEWKRGCYSQAKKVSSPKVLNIFHLHLVIQWIYAGQPGERA